MHQNAHGHRQKENGENAVNPGHGHIWKENVHKTKTPAAQHHTAALGEQGVDLVVVHKLIGKGEAVGEKAENQGCAQGYLVSFGLSAQPGQHPLKQQRVVFRHNGTHPFIFTIIAGFWSSVNRQKTRRTGLQRGGLVSWDYNSSTTASQGERVMEVPAISRPELVRRVFFTAAGKCRHWVSRPKFAATSTRWCPFSR